MIPRQLTRIRLIGMVGVASLAMLAVAVPTAETPSSRLAAASATTSSADRAGDASAAATAADTASDVAADDVVLAQGVAARTPKVKLSEKAREVGIEPGNAPMGWRRAKLGGVGVGSQISGQTTGSVTTANYVEGSATVTAAKAKLVSMSGVVGIDVSSYQGTVNWASYKSQKRVFAYIKATEGTSYRNPYFNSQYTGSAKAGLIRGAYHFANPSGASGKAQADYFVKNGGGWTADGKTLPGVLDIEYNPYGGNTCYGLSKKAMVSWIAAFVKEYKKKTTRDAVIYTTADWWKRCTGDTTKFNQTNPLWVARYGTSSPGTLPGKWPFYTFWQYSSSPIDQNKFSASLARLKVLAGSPID